MIISFVRYLIKYFLLIYLIVNTQQNFESRITLSNKGTKFVPKNSIESSLKNVYVSSSLRCAKQCNENIFCRTFIYDQITYYCQLYQSDLTSGDITSSTSSTSRVGTILYQQILYINYNKTCDQCQFNRYLTCQNSRCQCPSPFTYWNGFICRNKFYYGEICNSSTQCRQDLNLSCIFGSCQSNTAICKMDATPIIFDDIPNKYADQGDIPSIYDRLSWINGHYLNASIYPASGYAFVHASGEYVAWFNNVLTIQTLMVTNTVTLNSFIMAAGWSNSLFITIDGYYSSTKLYTSTASLNTYTQNLFTLNWPGLNKIVFTPSGSGYYDIGIDNLCITF